LERFSPGSRQVLQTYGQAGRARRIKLVKVLVDLSECVGIHVQLWYRLSCQHRRDILLELRQHPDWTLRHSHWQRNQRGRHRHCRDRQQDSRSKGFHRLSRFHPVQNRGTEIRWRFDLR
jgi:hypothetical protein